MYENVYFRCIDAGSENCPCELAMSNNCILCAKLSGEDCSRCNWEGVCVYNEFVQNGKRINSGRPVINAEITEKKAYDNSTVLFGLKVGKGFADKSFLPGSFVFVRNPDKSLYYDVPVSVMLSDTDTGIIYILVKTISAKTKALTDENESLIVRGPYHNGVFETKSLIREFADTAEIGKRILVAARGTGIAPALKLMQYMGNADNTDLIYDRAGISEEFDYDLFRAGRVDLNYQVKNSDSLKQDKFSLNIADFNEEKAGGIIKEALTGGHYGFFAIFASNYFQEKYNEIAVNSGFNGSILISNNYSLCCGEGICGACSIAGKKGETMKMCKCRLKAEDVIRHS